MSLIGFVVFRFGFVESLYARQYFFFKFYSVMSPGERWQYVCVSDLCSPSKIRSDHFHSPREIYSINPLPGNGTRICWS
jgi:hypothetical protein